MSDKLLDDKIKDVDARFEQTKKIVANFEEQISGHKEELIRLQGEYRALKSLQTSQEEGLKKPEITTVKAGSKSKKA